MTETSQLQKSWQKTVVNVRHKYHNDNKNLIVMPNPVRKHLQSDKEKDEHSRDSLFIDSAKLRRFARGGGGVEALQTVDMSDTQHSRRDEPWQSAERANH